MQFYLSYIQYFAALAASHLSLQYSESDNDTFTPISYFDLLNGVVSKKKMPHLFLLAPEFTLPSDVRAENFIKTFNCKFIVLDKAAPRNKTLADRNTIVDSAEQIADDILVKLINDMMDKAELPIEERTPFLVAGQITNVQGFKLGGINEQDYLADHIGWLYSFDVLFPLANEINQSRWV